MARRAILRKYALFAAVLVLFWGVSACDSKTAQPADKPEQPRSEGKTAQTSDADQQREKVLAEREKLLGERLELERQRAEIERQKREALEAQILAKQAAERSQQFSDDVFELNKDLIIRNADALGTLILKGTHPTGTYGRTGSPVVRLAGDRYSIDVSLTVYWKGFSDAAYETTYTFDINKRSGIGALKVVSDDAMFQPDQPHIRNTELALREIFKPDR